MRLPEDAARALEKLESAGWESYAVGGCVRDSLLGIEPHDWDLCTAAPPEAMKKVFAGERVIETGLKHGTLTLLAPSGPLEITTFRTESGYSDCRHPDRVSFVRDIHADLARRDFTVNAMAYSPVRGLRDDFGGREDLRNGVLRCVGDPGERFREDALRILRALRFAARFGLTIEEKTAAALRENRELLRNISPERIFSELKGILCARGAGEMLLAFPEVFFVILPELAPMRGFDTRRPQNHCWDVWGHTAHAVDAIAPESVKVVVKSLHGGMPYVAPTDMPAYKAAEKAVEATFGKKPLPFYSGGSIPIISGFESILGIKSLLIGFGLAEDAIHSPNESYGLEQFDKGVETIPLFYKYFAESE